VKVSKPDWKGRTVVCIASGPSLTAEDCEAVRRSGHPVIVVNTTFKLCPWADVLFGYDAKWWAEYHEEVKRVFKGRLISYAQSVRHLGVETTWNAPWFHNFSNSGASAIGLAVAGGASKVLLLGYDCQKTGGKVHWHGDHPAPLGNAKSMSRWPAHFQNVAIYANQQKVAVVNVSRETALKCFERQTLEQALCHLP
jgi:hypothetical protein